MNLLLSSLEISSESGIFGFNAGVLCEHTNIAFDKVDTVADGIFSSFDEVDVCGFDGIDIGLFDIDVGLFDIEVALFDIEVALFDIEVGLFDIEVGLFDVGVGLFDIEVGLFGVEVGPFDNSSDPSFAIVVVSEILDIF